MKRRPGFVTALVLIALGAVLVLHNFGLIPIGVTDLVPLWPVLLILLAIEMLVVRAESNLTYALGLMWAGVVIVAALALAWRATPVRPSETAATAPHESFTVALESAESANVRIQLGMGTLALTAAKDPAQLVEGVTIGERAALDASRRMDGTRALLTLTSDQTGGGLFDSVKRFPRDVRWEIGVTDRVPVALAIGLNAGHANVDLSALNLTSLDLGIGLGDATVILSHAVDADTRIVGTGGSLTLEVPAGVAARVQVPPRLTNVDVGPGFERTISGYQTANLDRALPHQTVRVELGAGRIHLR
jgi:hypothetical protein